MEDTKELNTPWLRLGAWVESHTSPRQFLLMLSLAVGVGAAIAAQTL